MEEWREREEDGKTLDLGHEQRLMDLEMESVNREAEITQVMISSHEVAHQPVLPNLRFQVKPAVREFYMATLGLNNGLLFIGPYTWRSGLY